MPKQWQICPTWLNLYLSLSKWVVMGPPTLKSHMGKEGPVLDSGKGPGTAGDVPGWQRSKRVQWNGQRRGKRVWRKRTWQWAQRMRQHDKDGIKGITTLNSRYDGAEESLWIASTRDLRKLAPNNWNFLSSLESEKLMYFRFSVLGIHAAFGLLPICCSDAIAVFPVLLLVLFTQLPVGYCPTLNIFVCRQLQRPQTKA